MNNSTDQQQTLTRVGGISHILRGTFGELFGDSNINNAAVASTESLDEIQTVSCVYFDSSLLIKMSLLTSYKPFLFISFFILQLY
jgi:hypothetical protein